MSFKITTAKTWSEQGVGKKLFNQIFSIDEMQVTKISAILFFSPKSSQIEPAEVTKLMGDVLIKIDYFQFRTKMHL